MRKILVVIIFCIFIFSVIDVQPSFAADATMGFSPNSGSFGKPFTATLVVDGHGDKFNAAEANIKIPSNLAIKDLTLGDCNFSFLITPTEQNPSFAGVILSAYDTKCTVYSLTLVPVAKGSATITIAKPSVRRYGDAVNILSSTTNASYDITAALQHPSVLGTQTAQNNLYTVLLTILSSQNTPTSNATVILNSVSGKNKQQKDIDASGKVQFTNLQKGIYDAVVMENGRKVGETIINVNGTNHVLALSIDLSAQKNNPLLKNTQSFIAAIENNPLMLIGILILGILVGIGIALLVVKLINRRSKNKTTSTP